MYMHLRKLKTHKAKTYSNERRNTPFSNNSLKQNDLISIIGRTKDQHISKKYIRFEQHSHQLNPTNTHRTLLTDISTLMECGEHIIFKYS